MALDKATLAGAQLRAVDAIEEAFLAPLLGKGPAGQGKPEPGSGMAPTPKGPQRAKVLHRVAGGGG